MLGLYGTIVNQATRVVGPTAALARDTEGFVFRDDFDRANEKLSDGPDWISTDGTGDDDIVSNVVVPQSPYGDAQHTGSTIPASACLQYNVRYGGGGNSFGGGYLRSVRPASHNADFVRLNVNTGLSRYQLEIESSNVLRASDDTGISETGRHTMRLVVEDLGASGIQARTYKVDIGALTDITSSLSAYNNQISTTQALEPADTNIIRLGFGAAAGPTTIIDEVMVFGRNVVVTGLSTGFKARLIGADTTGSLVAESGGTVTFDIDAVAMPITRVEVTNASDDLQAAFQDAAGSWGGDEYSFTE